VHFRMNVFHHFDALARGELLPFDGALHPRTELLERVFQDRFGDIHEDDLVTGRGADLANAAPHLAGADNSNRLDVLTLHGYSPSILVSRSRTYSAPVPLWSFHDHGQRLAASDAETGEPSSGATVLHGVDQRREKARTGGADRMAERDGPTVDVHSLGVEL
jgi:hypothetical protein